LKLSLCWKELVATRECLGKGGSREQTYVIQEANSHLNN
jgi:hypothetical protein